MYLYGILNQTFPQMYIAIPPSEMDHGPGERGGDGGLVLSGKTGLEEHLGRNKRPAPRLSRIGHDLLHQ